MDLDVRRRFPSEIMRDVLHTAQTRCCAAEIAASTGLNGPSLDRYVGLLASKDFLDQDAEGNFLITARGQEFLRDLHTATRHFR